MEPFTNKDLGKIVSRRKLGAYDGAGKWSEEVTPIFLDTSSGVFSIRLPEEVAAVGDSTLNLDKDISEGRGPNVRRGVIFGGDLNGTVEHFKVVMARFKRWLDDQKAEKMICVFFERNVRHIRGFHDVHGKTSFVGYGGQRGDISFTGTPAMHLSFGIVYQIEGKLFTRSDGRYHSAESGPRKPYRVMPWTEEKENFLAATVGAFEGLICKVELFCDDVEANIARAIETGSTGLLAAPKTEETF